MNPTGRNLASQKSWKGRKSPWLVQKIFGKCFSVDLIDKEIYEEILSRKPKEWDYSFADDVYEKMWKNTEFL